MVKYGLSWCELLRCVRLGKSRGPPCLGFRVVTDWLEDSATVHPLDGKRALLEIARRLLDTGAPFQGISDLLGIRFKAHTDPSDSITGFNAALKSARRNTLDDDEVKEQFISALDGVFYAPVVSRLFTHQQQAAVDLLAMQKCVSECGYVRHVQAGTHTALSAAAVTTDCDWSQLSDLTAIILDVKRQLKSHGRKRVAFHKGSGNFIPFCGNETCKKGDARHWRRDCPNGGKHGDGGHFGSFSVDDVENDLLAEQFQVVMDENDDARFDALCLLAGGKPEMLDGVSAYSFGVVPEQVPSALQEFLPYCQSITHMGAFTVGGVAGGLPSSFASTHVREDAPPAPLTVADTHVDSGESVVSDEGAPLPVDPMHAHEPDLCFADRIAQLDGLSVTQEGVGFALRCMHAGSEDGSDGIDADEYADEDAPADDMASPKMPSHVLPSGCGKPPIGLGRSSAITLFLCAFFCVCSTAAPLSAAAFGGACMDEGYWHPVPVFPPSPGLDSPPPSPDYSPGPTDDKAEASIDDRGGVSSSFCSTNESTPTTTLLFGGTLTMLQAGTTVQQPTTSSKVNHAVPAQ
ncbi:hypothetical protein CYMTET_31727 [Cymbomonas tetramitiformis]|uniref:Uncharacterized protein n=1 Tax=Cymbomonas tetramitiformis TaxID=36881 RepID=A0AAE0FGH4_9CHLO|nr:hypothetical protein CYMTET_31727 [Cymbomonas tetramitiformis]